ncbi:FAD-dependent oxidoreductase [Geminocystis sp. NIES-3709]|uniref:FAD-dependent oxidoreductase n=1 Tax=Geminocystis sp. NIES-3709 TaxID=1617448 RepID=UPI0005FCA994|nr:FAD-dependent oxidoreductase [Geminocystis sp. NIES-3709]BAQ65379.1 NADH dehydrogenase-like protein [Geminocystis sp. NIES-3709]
MVNLVLVGGGHSNAIVLKLWSKKKVSGVKLTLISNAQNTPYSGMLPGYIAGCYNYEESHINLVKLAEIAGIELVIDEVINIDADKKIVSCKSGQKFSFDIISLDIGSIPKNSQIEGANLYTIPIKPVPLFLTKWAEIVNLAQSNPDNKISISIIGGGAGGVELALNIHQKLNSILSLQKININLLHKGDRIVENHPISVSNKLTKNLDNRNINLYLNTVVTSVENQDIILDSNIKIFSDYIFLVTQPSAPLWLQNTSIETDKDGFILVNNSLQSVNYPYIFASGDIANIVNYSCPKAGVFAVKQGIPLYKNLCNFLTNQPLKLYYPQQHYLNIIGTGNKNAVASWGKISIESPIIWYWKKYLDYNFMKQFTYFP